MDSFHDDVAFLILNYLSLEEATALRCANKNFLDKICRNVWRVHAHSCFDLSKWRSCFPYARAIGFNSRKIKDVSEYLHPQLEFVEVCNCRVGGASFAQLHTLALPFCLDVTGDIFENLIGLTYLNVRSCTEFNGDALLGLTNLKTLIADGCIQLQDQHFRTLENLQMLNVGGCEFWGDFLCKKKLKWLQIPDTLIHSDIFQHLNGLEYLDAPCAIISHRSFFVSASTLISVNLDYIDWLSGEIADMPNLNKASLRGTKFSTLRAFKTAKWFDLTDAWLDGIRDLRGSLDYLDVTGGTYRSPHFLTNLDYIDVLISYNCDFNAKVFQFCPLVRFWSVGCQMLEVLDQEQIFAKMETEFVESCHQDMCYC